MSSFSSVTTPRISRPLAALLLSLGLTAAACGSDDDSTPTETDTPTA